MMGSRKTSAKHQPLIKYATTADFCAIFARHIDELYQLSFLLTADHQKAEECFVAGLEDSAKDNHVFREWARSWAKRAIIQNAIRRINPHRDVSSFPLAPPPGILALPNDPGRHFEVEDVLALEDFERFVFVISVLEHYSEHECSLLLGCSPRQIREAQVRAFARLLNSPVIMLPGKVPSETIHEVVR